LVVQVKKAAVRDAILAAAYKTFCEHSYNASTLAQVAERAGVSTANLYSYFDSKLDLLYTIYDPWLRERLEQLDIELATIQDSHLRLRRLLKVLWRDIPHTSNGFANNIMQAVSGLGPRDQYDPKPLLWYEDKVGQMILNALPIARRSTLDVACIAHLAFMAFDGFAISAHANPRSPCSDALIEQFCELLMGPSDPKNKRNGIKLGTRKRARLGLPMP